jgi:uncharacterized MAPEG superfamily protein
MSIALWCLLFAGIFPILIAGYAKSLGGSYDNARPRDVAQHYEGKAKRAHAAHLNSFEAFPLFAAAVLVAEMKGAPRGMVDLLAVVHITCRVGYVGAYVFNKATLRSVLWSLALFTAIGIFISPLWR